jgi:hypothetical protein
LAARLGTPRPTTIRDPLDPSHLGETETASTSPVCCRFIACRVARTRFGPEIWKRGDNSVEGALDRKPSNLSEPVILMVRPSGLLGVTIKTKA